MWIRMTRPQVEGDFRRWRRAFDDIGCFWVSPTCFRWRGEGICWMRFAAEPVEQFLQYHPCARCCCQLRVENCSRGGNLDGDCLRDEKRRLVQACFCKSKAFDQSNWQTSDSEFCTLCPQVFVRFFLWGEKGENICTASACLLFGLFLNMLVLLDLKLSALFQSPKSRCLSHLLVLLVLPLRLHVAWRFKCSIKLIVLIDDQLPRKWSKYSGLMSSRWGSLKLRYAFSCHHMVWDKLVSCTKSDLECSISMMDPGFVCV